MNARVEGCPFCAIASGSGRADTVDADIVYEDDAVVCFLPRELYAYGHTLIVPKAHYTTVWDIDRHVLGRLLAVMQELCIQYRSRVGATGFNLLHASGPDAQQSVPHFHMHLLPRFAGDGLDAWPPLPGVHTDRLELLARLRSPHPQPREHATDCVTPQENPTGEPPTRTENAGGPDARKRGTSGSEGADGKGRPYCPGVRLPQPSGALDVGEQRGDGAAGQSGDQACRSSPSSA
jgi:histidine triad (HIT) family protein